MSHVESILRVLKKNPVEKHEAFLVHGDVVSQEASTNELQIGDVKILRRVGLGTHAEVYEVAPCRIELRDVRLALKIEKPIKHASGFIDQEISVLGSVSDECVPKLLGVFTKEIGGVICRGFCMELFHDSLSSLKPQKTLSDIANATLRDSFILYIASRMFDAVLRFHKFQYLHRDIKPSNFMFKIVSPDSFRLALVDFGSAIPFGDRNSAEFRGTGAYAPIDTDPWLSKPEDDYWSIVFSVIDLCIPGGLPWRSLSARTDEGRAEIVSQKQAFFQSISNNYTTDLTIHIPNTLKELIKSLIENPDSIKDTIMDLVSSPNISESTTEKYIELFMSPSPMRINLPKSLTPASALLNRSSRAIIENECEVPAASSSVLFPIPQNSDDVLVKVQAMLHQAVTNKHIAKTPDVLALGERICLSELTLGDCHPRCPLRHLSCSGIARAAIVRSTTRLQKICMQNFFDKCSDKNCDYLHLDSDTVRRMYIDGQVPSYRPSKRSKHS